MEFGIAPCNAYPHKTGKSGNCLYFSLVIQVVLVKMASAFFSSTLTNTIAHVGSLGEVQVGRRTVQIKGRLAEGMQVDN